MENLGQEQVDTASAKGNIYTMLGCQGLLKKIIEYLSLYAKDVRNLILSSFIKQFNRGQALLQHVSKEIVLSFFEIRDHPQVLSFCKQKVHKPIFYLDLLCESKLLQFKMVFDIQKKYKFVHSLEALNNKRKPTPFLVACEKGYLADVKVFVNLLKVDVNQKGITSQGYACGYSGLILAAYAERLNVVNYLLRHCKDTINAELEDNYGSTALHYCAYNSRRNTATIKSLLEYGCNARKKNQSGLTPLDYAQKNESLIKSAIVSLLKDFTVTQL